MATLIDRAEFVADKIANIPKPEATLTDVSVKRGDPPRSTARVVVSGTMLNPRWIKAAGEVTNLEVPRKVPYDPDKFND